MNAKKAWVLIFLVPVFQVLVAQQLQVIVFMSETCPICKSVTSELRGIDEIYPDSVLSITAYFPTRTAKDPESLRQFARKYNLRFDLIPDSNFIHCSRLQATVTPEAFLIDVSTNRIMYRGMIDDSYASVGKRRTIVQNQYLRDAIEAYRNGKTPVITETQTVGCIIQYP